MAQLRDHDAIQAKRDFFMVDPRKLSVDPTYNVRDLVGPLVDLANQAFDDGHSEATVPLTLLQSLDTIYRQARGE